MQFENLAKGGSTVVEHLPHHPKVKGLSSASATGIWIRHDQMLRQPMNLKQDFSIPVPPVPFLTSW